MDPRIRRHAELLVDHCTNTGPGDDVLIKAPPAAEPLVVALYEKFGERGARPTTTMLSRRAGRAYARKMDVDEFRTKEHELAAMRASDVVILVQAGTNASESSDVTSEKKSASNRAGSPVLDARLDGTRWVITRHPTPADAQRAGRSTAAWTDTVYDAVDRDWSAVRERQSQLVEMLDEAAAMRVVAGEDTDLHLSIDGMAAASDDGTENLPGGEVYTSPVVGSVEGAVQFDVPVTRNGREIRDARLTFADGEVVEHAAARGEAELRSVLETDPGARRVGEFGIGTNRGVERVTGFVLFDEKMAGTVHLALGNAMAECVPDGKTFNESATHVDLLVDVREDASVEVDGEVVLRDGEFTL